MRIFVQSSQLTEGSAAQENDDRRKMYSSSWKPPCVRKHSKPWTGLTLFSLKGWHNIAQGNALGSGQMNTFSLKG
jgi:hypothetical protein